MTISDYRNLNKGKFYTTAVRVGGENYNPRVRMYYNSSDELVKVSEEWRSELWEQTISGSGITTSGISYEIVYDPWVQII